MRITRRTSTTVPGVGELPASDQSADAGAADGGSRISDRVQVSEGARLRQRLKAEIGDVGATDPARLDALAADVASGTYAPEPYAVAHRMLGELTANLLA